MVTLAPELPGALDVVGALVANGVVVSAGHSAATWAQAQAGFDAGIRSVTHLFNAMAKLDHREPGLPGAALADDRVTIGLIPDGLHVHPGLVALVRRTVGPERLAVVTDAIAALGMPPGEHRLAGRDVIVDETSCRLPDGTLAGSLHRARRGGRATSPTFAGCSTRGGPARDDRRARAAARRSTGRPREPARRDPRAAGGGAPPARLVAGRPRRARDAAASRAGRVRRHRRARHERPRRDLRPVPARRPEPARRSGSRRRRSCRCTAPSRASGVRSSSGSASRARRRTSSGSSRRPPGRARRRSRSRTTPRARSRRPSDHVLELAAGPELAIAATKTYTTSLLAIARLSLALEPDPAASGGPGRGPRGDGRRARRRAGRRGARRRARRGVRVIRPVRCRRARLRVRHGARVGAEAQGARPGLRRSLFRRGLPARPDRARAAGDPGTRPRARGPGGRGPGELLRDLRERGVDTVVVSDVAATRALGRWSIPDSRRRAGVAPAGRLDHPGAALRVST